MLISIVVAADKQNGIGFENRLLCHLPNDLKYFKQITTGHCIVMGRKTYESIGRLLPNRTNIIISSNSNLKIEGAVVVSDVDKAIDYATSVNETELMITGGGKVYQELITRVDKIYLTRIEATFNADTFFPPIDKEIFSLVSTTKHEADEKHACAYTFEIWERKA
ncbi:MAG: dihydrofolate reductase [Bacteroidia bacterium]|jgi:dihydrofolate reductase|nr:dihydrofolate reductase [Bacteroidia bacterium]